MSKKLDKLLCERAGGTWVEGKRCEGHLCETCGSNGGGWDLERSHIIAKSRLGKDTEENILIECRVCHERFEKKPEAREEYLRGIKNCLY